MEYDIKFYIIVAILAIFSIASVLTLNPFIILISLSVAILIVAFYKLDYIVEAVIFKRTNLIQVVDGCEISGDRSTVTRKLGDKFCATAVASLENNSNESIERTKIENIIANSHCVFKFVIQVERLDISKLLNKMYTRRSMKEIELSRLNKSYEKDNIAKSNTLKRQMDQIEHEIERINSGGTPLKVSQYIMTSSISDNKFSAQDRAKSQLRELVSEFGALLGVRCEILNGNDMLRLLKFDSAMVQ